MRLWLFRFSIAALLLIMGLVAGRILTAPARIEVIQPVPREVVELVVASGRLRALQQSNVGLEVAGVTAQVHVREGDRVTSGQRLLELRHDSAAASLEQARKHHAIAERELVRLRRGPLPEEIARARAEREERRSLEAQSRLELARIRELREAGVSSQADYDLALSTHQRNQAAVGVAEASLALLLAHPPAEEIAVAEAEVAEAAAAIQLAETQLAKHFLHAPFDALVIRRDVEPGQMVNAGAVLFHLANLDSLEVHVETDEINIAKLRRDQPATVIAPAYRDQPFNATLLRIGPEIDPTRGVVTLRLQPETLPDFALPDLTVDVNIEVARLEAAMTVPRSALIEIGGETRLYRIDTEAGNVVREEVVRVLARGTQFVAIEGLAPGSRIVRDGTVVRSGQVVRPQLLEDSDV